MLGHIQETLIKPYAQPWWQPYMSLLVTLGSIVLLRANLMQITMLFWWEIILMIAFALLRALFALDNRSFFDNLFQRIFMLVMAGFLGIGFVMLTVAFTINGINTDRDLDNGFNVVPQLTVLVLSYSAGFVLHYLMNGTYKKANFFGEMMRTYVHVLVLLALLQVFTMHLIPRIPGVDAAIWGTVALVAIKFLVDVLSARLKEKGPAFFSS